MKKILISLVASFTMANSVFAAPFTNNVNNDVYSGIVNGIPTANDNNDGVPDLHDAVNNILGTSYTRNSDLDNRFVAQDEVFTNYGTSKIALIGLTAGNNNTLGIYQGANQTEVLPYHSAFGYTGNGSSNNPYAGASYTINGDFSWYLQANGPYSYDTYYSEAALNAGGWDHMMTFELSELNGQTRYLEVNGQTLEHTFTNAYLIGWEDLPYGYQNQGMLGDDDYDDMMYLIDFSIVDEVPEPLSGLLFALSLLTLISVRRAKQ